jgi:hypothetical protein
MHAVVHPVAESNSNGLGGGVPMMYFKSVSVLGVLGGRDHPRISFSLLEKPFSADTWFHLQHLVASVRVFSALYGDDEHTLDLP